MDPEKLLADIIADPDPNSDRVGHLTNCLLSEYHRGYPLENLRPLLRSENKLLVHTGIFIASELGPKGKPLLCDVSPFLQHPEKWVRAMTLDCVLLWAGPTDKSELVSGVALLNDVDAAVRWAAMRFLAAASREQLQAALSHLQATEARSTHVRGLQWLLGADAGKPSAVMTTLHNEDRLIRKYGAVAAARISKTNTEPLMYASTVEDPDIKDFAESSIRLLRK